MSNNGTGTTVECLECAWQGDEIHTDTHYCPNCGAECMDLEAIYGPDGLHPDPEWKSK
ncbi:hypothetical protein [Cupriavidus sp. UYPR2.512]|uniref:hypothetical protein n=1 Tax=Cupriavidus sp. UYPR2.512 TaxID=1080187 RepID=UPI0012FB73CB|nr:hypothetical protein [Cupriavidus sp. UYPR2.512]UIF90874.1 hypothetical protein KAF44_32315 [Cupriavidus necator]